MHDPLQTFQIEVSTAPPAGRETALKGNQFSLWELLLVVTLATVMVWVAVCIIEPRAAKVRAKAGFMEWFAQHQPNCYWCRKKVMCGEAVRRFEEALKK